MRARAAARARVSWWRRRQPWPVPDRPQASPRTRLLRVLFESVALRGAFGILPRPLARSRAWRPAAAFETRACNGARGRAAPAAPIRPLPHFSGRRDRAAPVCARAARSARLAQLGRQRPRWGDAGTAHGASRDASARKRASARAQSPFGDAKPRETVIAKRTGKNEAEILQAEAETYEVKLRLTSEQFAEKKERLDQIEELKATIQTGEPDEVTAAEVQNAAPSPQRPAAAS